MNTTVATGQPARAPIKGTLARLRHLAVDCYGSAMVEFALSLPLLVTIAVGGLETAQYMLLRRRISDVAAQVADNASRIGEGSGLAAKKVREVDVNDVFTGAIKQSGGIDLMGKGRIILSSLEVNADGGQWIHWQRCYGGKSYNSAYGTQDTGKTGNAFAGMGPGATKVQAFEQNAIMFVEVAYTYESIMPFELFAYEDIKEIASFAVRDMRDLSGLTNPAPEATVNSC